jgi:hypothetical protein
MFFLESIGEKAHTVGVNKRRNGKLPLAAARTCGADRIYRTDARQLIEKLGPAEAIRFKHFSPLKTVLELR